MPVKKESNFSSSHSETSRHELTFTFKLVWSSKDMLIKYWFSNYLAKEGKGVGESYIADAVKMLFISIIHLKREDPSCRKRRRQKYMYHSYYSTFLQWCQQTRTYRRKWSSASKPTFKHQAIDILSPPLPPPSSFSFKSTLKQTW